MWLNPSNQAKVLCAESKDRVLTAHHLVATHSGFQVLTIWKLSNRILQSTCQLTEASEVMELLRNVGANGLGLLILWALHVVLLMAYRSLMVVCIATSIVIMPRDFAMVVLLTFKMVMSAGLAGLVTVSMVP